MKALGEKVKVKSGDKTLSFTKKSCSTSKDTATKEAENVRKSGVNARVIYDAATKKHCVYTGAKTKPRGRK